MTSPVASSDCYMPPQPHAFSKRPRRCANYPKPTADQASDDAVSVKCKKVKAEEVKKCYCRGPMPPVKIDPSRDVEGLEDNIQASGCKKRKPQPVPVQDLVYPASDIYYAAADIHIWSKDEMVKAEKSKAKP